VVIVYDAIFPQVKVLTINIVIKMMLVYIKGKNNIPYGKKLKVNGFNSKDY
jgi:hypothetical protein